MNRHIVLLLAAGLFFLTGCSSEEKSPESTPISRKAEQTGKEAAAAIKTPIEQAGVVTDLQKDHNQVLQEQAASQ